MIDEKLTKELACVDGFQSFWACSRCAGGLLVKHCRLGTPMAAQPQRDGMHALQGYGPGAQRHNAICNGPWHRSEKKGYSGVATYASEAWAPLSAEADCLGSGEDDIDREGRWVGACD